METYPTYINKQGQLIIPPEVAHQLGLTPGAKVTLEAEQSGFSVARPITSLKRVYLEITNQCNLNCATCMRNIWDVAFGAMSIPVFDKILEDLESYAPKPEIFIGGYGEPLSNPNCLSMIELAKSKGIRVSMITNGVLLTESISRQLIDLKLDMLWISLDGASPECYADVRMGDELPGVIDNLKRLRAIKWWKFGASPWSGYPHLGIAFVAMKRNIHEMADVIKIGSQLGAVEISISNLLAHDSSMRDDNLYLRSMNQVASRQAQQWKPLIHLPRMDIDSTTREAITSILKSTNQMEFFGSKLNQNVDRCPFVQRGSLSIRWDGKVSPCLPLMYNHTYYLNDRERSSEAFFVGDIKEQPLSEVWDDPEYLHLRDRLQKFDYSPCTYCNSCEMANSNQGDCYGNTMPACGGCLWAQGLVRCP